MTWTTLPVTPDRFDDFADVINPNRRATHCWCLSHRLPVDPPGRMDLTMAFVGTRAMFEKAGFEVVGRTDTVASKLPRLVMRRDLAPVSA